MSPMLTKHTVPFAACKQCEFYVDGIVWKACRHDLSRYKDGTVTVLHSTKHMRIAGACGKGAVLFIKKK